MTARPHPDEFELDAFLRQQESKSLLRIVVCGSVDHGKSTLIGRLLYESKLLFEDQLRTLEAESRKYGTQGGELDFALLLDGLAAEREQKITIDVAYRFLSTKHRKFIVADAPGHEQYTRNMATGASTADVALILVNAEAGLTRQTKRHSLIVSTLGVRYLVVAVNKMDLVAWSEPAFRAIEADFRAFADALDIDEIVCIPISARSGDNVVSPSALAPWYRGPTLLSYLEAVDVASSTHPLPFRMPVQLVNRPNSDFRGYSGLIAGGDVHVGMPVRILPSGQTSQVERIVTFDGDVTRAAAGQSVTVTLAGQVDASRGDVIADIKSPPAVTNRLRARVVWMGREEFAPGRPYLIKLGTATARAAVEPSLSVLDLDTRELKPADRLLINDIGECTLRLDRAIAADVYSESRDTGSFILIDPESYDTVGMGIIEAPPDTGVLARLRRRFRLPIGADRSPGRTRWDESHLRSIAKAISWRATGSIDTFIVTFIITRSSVFAGSVAITEIMTKVFFYYCHERVWSMIPWGKK